MRTRSIRPNCKPLTSASPTSNRAWTPRVSPTFSGTAIYVVVIILLAAAQAIAIVVIAYGFIATAVCVLVGPVFIPFFIVPKLEWLFWGWFKCFIQYAFYQVIAAAVVYIIGNLILGILRPSTRRAPFPPSSSSGWFPVLFITFVASIYALLKIPALTNHIFSGTSGGSSGGNSAKGSSDEQRRELSTMPSGSISNSTVTPW